MSGGENAGKSVEAFIPGVGTCKLPDLPQYRIDHIMETIDDKPVICFGIQYGCTQFTPTGRNFGIWQDLVIDNPWAGGSRIGGQNKGSWVSSAGLVVLDTNEARIMNTTKTIEIRYPR